MREGRIMCGRFVIVITSDMAAALLDVENGFEAASWNVAPTQEAPVVLQQGNRREMTQMRFGFLPPFAKHPREGARFINARSETVAKLPAFRQAFHTRRCLVPATGFYEWADGPTKQPWFYSPIEHPLLSFAGVSSRWKDGDRDLHSFAILTTTPNRIVAPVHDRSPLMLTGATRDRWPDNRPMDDSALASIVDESLGVRLDAWTVDKRVGNVRNNDPGLIDQVDSRGDSVVPAEARAD